MLTISSVQEMQLFVANCRKNSKTIGFAPTMGALHEGHLSLIKMSKRKGDITVCSIFVNPTQFNDKKDLEKYPRNFERDAKMLEEIGCDVLFHPSVEEIYPPNLDTTVKLNLGDMTTVMEGEFRPGHFDGMAQVVNRLLDIVTPDHLYMGQKDFQQFSIVAAMIRQLSIPTQLVVCPILREPNGLAMSSRNERLSPALRDKAALIYKTLQWLMRNKYKYPVEMLEQKAIQKLSVTDFKPEYVRIVNGNTLQPVAAMDAERYVVVCVATWVGEVRLIDNKILKKAG